MAAARFDPLEMLGAELTPRAAAVTLTLVGPPPAAAHALPPAAIEWTALALRALAEAAIARAGGARPGGKLTLAVGVVGAAGAGRLRALAVDSLPGQPAAAQPPAFAYLAGEAAPPAPDPLGLAALRAVPALGELDFASGADGNWLWSELDLPGVEPGGALPGWSRRPRLDGDDLLRRLGGNAQIARVVIATFRAEAPGQLAALAAALDPQPAEALRQAHSLKGAARNVGGLMLGEVAAAVEAALREGRLEQARAALPRLDWEFARLDAAWAAAPL